MRSWILNSWCSVLGPMAPDALIDLCERYCEGIDRDEPADAFDQVLVVLMTLSIVATIAWHLALGAYAAYLIASHS